MSRKKNDAAYESKWRRNYMLGKWERVDHTWLITIDPYTGYVNTLLDVLLSYENEFEINTEHKPRLYEVF